MDLIKQFIAGSDSSELILQWSEPDTSQAVLKTKVQLYLQELSKNKTQIVCLLI